MHIVTYSKLISAYFMHVLKYLLVISCLFLQCIIFAYFYIFWHFVAYLLHIHAFVCIFVNILILTMQQSTYQICTMSNKIPKYAINLPIMQNHTMEPLAVTQTPGITVSRMSFDTWLLVLRVKLYCVFCMWTYTLCVSIVNMQ